MFKIYTVIYKIFIVNLILGFTFSFGAQFSWNLDIINSSYTLKMEMDYPLQVSLQQVRNDFKSFSILARVSGPIKDGQIHNLVKGQGFVQYRQVLKLKSYGVSSELSSSCIEEITKDTWKRKCDLDTEIGGGKLSMIQKYDQVKCHERSGSFGVKCYFEIIGTAKDIEILRLTLISAKKLVLKGKFEAVKNFSKIWYLRSGSVANISGSLALYRSRSLDKSIIEMYENGLTKLAGSEGGFQYSFSGRVSN